MPNLAAHIDLAHQAAKRLSNPDLDTYVGHYLLGSTAPDVRVITRKSREDYHFAPLTFAEVGAGVQGLFDAHPHLRSTANGDGPTRAFIAGYITHLVLDESWITQLYRPRFANPRVFPDEAYGKVMDRVLQLELDRQATGAATTALPLLAGAGDSVDVAFISSETLADWRKWVLELVGRGFAWERLRHQARRIAEGDDSHPAHAVAEDFLRAMPDSLDRLFEIVTPDQLAGFKDRAVEALSQAVEEYMS